ncbi:MAG: type II secretion system F family protein [Candidatus Omnitrophica bacterium]|nr:type II secretion system F family protein [Candidatus Omnitrophota bacterium]
MATYLYVARDQEGTAHNGQLDAINEDDVVSVLQHRGLLVTSVMRKDQTKAPTFTARRVSRRMHTGVKTDDQVLLCQQLATLVEAGVPLLRSLEVVSAQVESRRLLLALEEIKRDVEAGSTLRGALAKHPAIFSRLWLNLVETGETSGHLAESLQQLARHFEASRHLQNETVTALTYPVFLGIAAVCVLAVFVYWLIPKFEGLFATMEGMELPLITRLVIRTSELARQYVRGDRSWVGRIYLFSAALSQD